MEPRAMPLLLLMAELYPIRLVDGGNTCEGRVEIFYKDAWESVCDSYWNHFNAEVVCRQLGCGMVHSAPKNAYFGQGDGAILLDYVNCHGDEPSLLHCRHAELYKNTCGHNNDAGVICLAASTKPTPGTTHSVAQRKTRRTKRTTATEAAVASTEPTSGTTQRTTKKKTQRTKRTTRTSTTTTSAPPDLQTTMAPPETTLRDQHLALIDGEASLLIVASTEPTSGTTQRTTKKKTQRTQRTKRTTRTSTTTTWGPQDFQTTMAPPETTVRDQHLAVIDGEASLLIVATPTPGTTKITTKKKTQATKKTRGRKPTNVPRPTGTTKRTALKKTKRTKRTQKTTTTTTTTESSTALQTTEPPAGPDPTPALQTTLTPTGDEILTAASTRPTPGTTKTNTQRKPQRTKRTSKTTTTTTPTEAPELQTTAAATGTTPLQASATPTPGTTTRTTQKKTPRTKRTRKSTTVTTTTAESVAPTTPTPATRTTAKKKTQRTKRTRKTTASTTTTGAEQPVLQTIVTTVGTTSLPDLQPTANPTGTALVSASLSTPTPSETAPVPAASPTPTPSTTKRKPERKTPRTKRTRKTTTTTTRQTALQATLSPTATVLVPAAAATPTPGTTKRTTHKKMQRTKRTRKTTTKTSTTITTPGQPALPSTATPSQTPSVPALQNAGTPAGQPTLSALQNTATPTGDAAAPALQTTASATGTPLVTAQSSKGIPTGMALLSGSPTPTQGITKRTKQTKSRRTKRTTTRKTTTTTESIPGGQPTVAPAGMTLSSDASRRPTLGTTQRTKPKKTRRTKRTTTAKTTATTGLPDLQITVKPPVSSFSPDCTKAQTPFGTAGYSCGGVLSDPAGSFSSPLYPGQYPNKAQCMWQIEVKGNLCIKVIIGSLRLEPSPDCVSDYVAVYDGPFRASPLLGQICQNSYYNFTSTSNVITVQFVSGLSGTDMGFQVVYYAYKCDTGSIVDLTCSTGSMKAAIPAAYLQSLGYSAADVSLNDPSCLPEVTDELVTFDISYTQCGTVKTVDNSTITYSNSLSVLPSRNLVTRQKKLNMAVRCKMHQGTKVGIAYQLEDAVPIQKTQYGHFDLSVLFYNSSLFLASTGQPPYAFNPDQEMYVEAVLPSSDPDLQLFVDTCVASASQTDFKTISYDLIRNGCIQDSTYRTLPSPSSKNARFSFGAFPFLRQNKRIFLQCEMVVCSESDPSSRCRQVHHRRRKRSLGSYLNAKDILLGPIQLVG